MSPQSFKIKQATYVSSDPLRNQRVGEPNHKMNFFRYRELGGKLEKVDKNKLTKKNFLIKVILTKILEFCRATGLIHLQKRALDLRTER